MGGLYGGRGVPCTQPKGELVDTGDMLEQRLHGGLTMPPGSASGFDADVAAPVTYRRALVLRELADGRTEREAAETLGLSYTGLRSHTAVLLEISQSPDVRELGRWWRRHRAEWVAIMAEAAGAEFSR